MSFPNFYLFLRAFQNFPSLFLYICVCGIAFSRLCVKPQAPLRPKRTPWKATHLRDHAKLDWPSSYQCKLTTTC
ncbi:hypothetical protein NPIL_240161 [Nephila pilipes]|uniref:Uncharacterized protein n=1 Tax=Nephila pilipes TaxID=299642 RepID=A0A8X6IM53_NEPPI|nr:hypothetical protein NPIL_240161 [Nephila pilipes]